MTKPNINSKKGFTIIEVVLVLAIAGLIFLMVFIALPNLQRTRRDTQRRNDVDRLSAALVQYVANNNRLPDYTSEKSTDTIVGAEFETESGLALPEGAKNLHQFYWKYLLSGGNDKFEDPDGGNYNIFMAKCEKDTGEGAAAGCADSALQSSETTSPLNEAYEASSLKEGVTPSSEYTMVIAAEATCGSEDDAGGIIQPVTGTRRFAVAMLLEGSGVYCVNN